VQKLMETQDNRLDPVKFPSSNMTAVIDIGSNSVRLVVFDGPSRVPMPKFNEKVLCGLGRNLSTSNLLSEQSMQGAMTALRRYTALVTHMGIDRIIVAATAAVREADNGSEFVSAIEQECDLNVQVLSGRQEARYAGLGVLSGMPFADGLVGDLGGGSLELVKLHDHNVEDTETLPLGALRLSQLGMAEEDLIADLQNKFQKIEWLDALRGKNFYVVGGAWRALAKYNISKSGHPLNLVHNYKLTFANMKLLIDEILSMSVDELKSNPHVQRSRATTLHTAATIMDQLFKVVQPKNVVFSANGLREGLLFSELKKPVRRLDPLLEACRDMAAKEGRFAEHGVQIFDWMTPTFPDLDEKGRRLALAAATLSDIAWSMSSDYRAAQAFRRIFRAPFSGIGHKGRAIVALTVYARYSGNLTGHAPEDGLALMDEDAQRHALSIGLALRLSHSLSGGTTGILPLTKLVSTDDEIILEIPENMAVLSGVHVENRLASLGDSLGKRSSIRIIPVQ